MRKCAAYMGSPFQAELMLLGYYLLHYIMVYLLFVINVKNVVYKNGSRRLSCTSETANIHVFVRFVM